MTTEKTNLNQVTIGRAGEIMIGSGGGLLAAAAVDSIVGGPVDRSTGRLSEGANASNQEFFPYDVGVEMASSMLAGALIAAKLFKRRRRV